MYSSVKVIFEGKKFSNDLIRLYQNASCFVCPSIFEPWGLVVNEALSAGLAVIATKEVGATFNLIKNKETGLIAETMDDFGNKMLQIFNNEVLLRKFSNNARELMQNYWNYELYSKAQDEVINKVKQWD
jgi:glycosyltransferase involved in cell wall biosynthesis